MDKGLFWTYEGREAFIERFFTELEEQILVQGRKNLTFRFYRKKRYIWVKDLLKAEQITFRTGRDSELLCSCSTEEVKIWIITLKGKKAWLNSVM